MAICIQSKKQKKKDLEDDISEKETTIQDLNKILKQLWNLKEKRNSNAENKKLEILNKKLK